ncbi:MAG: glycosyltransferase family 1 protein [Candidatus Heimdallarchaeota archaeon]|nr:glycosyltransferase family 1 protein [Candidatus Heimdallarchaeota archaeon]
MNADGQKAIIVTQMTKDDSIKEEIIDDIPIYRLNCGDFIDRINLFEKMPMENRESKAHEFFNKNDIENTAKKFADALADFIIKQKPQVIHFHNSFFITPYGLYFLKQKYDNIPQVPFYFWTHSPPKQLTLPNGLEKPLFDALRSFQNLFKGVFSVSLYVHDNLTKFGIKNKVIPLGIDKEFFSKDNERGQSTRNRLKISDGSFVVLYTGRIIKEKGLDILPEIYQQLLKRGSEYLTIQFLIVGEGDYKNTLMQDVESRNLSHRFKFVNAKNNDELLDYYSCANCFILPTRREALGLSLLEAMSCSLPCIATNLPSIKEIINHTINGIIIKQDDIAEFVRWLSGLFSNKALRASLSEAARKTIEEKFNAENHYRYFTNKLLK